MQTDLTNRAGSLFQSPPQTHNQKLAHANIYWLDLVSRYQSATTRSAKVSENAVIGLLSITFSELTPRKTLRQQAVKLCKTDAASIFRANKKWQALIEQVEDKDSHPALGAALQCSLFAGFLRALLPDQELREEIELDFKDQAINSLPPTTGQLPF